MVGKQGSNKISGLISIYKIIGTWQQVQKIKKFKIMFHCRPFTAPKLEIYESTSKKNLKEWYWQIMINAKIVAASSEGYRNRTDCIDNLLKVEGHIKYLREQNLIK